MIRQRSTRSLTDAEVVEMRRRRAAGERMAIIADEFGVSHTTAVYACTGRLYAELPGAVPGRSKLAGRPDPDPEPLPQPEPIPAIPGEYTR